MGQAFITRRGGGYKTSETTQNWTNVSMYKTGIKIELPFEPVWLFAKRTDGTSSTSSRIDKIFYLKDIDCFMLSSNDHTGSWSLFDFDWDGTYLSIQLKGNYVPNNVSGTYTIYAIGK